MKQTEVFQAPQSAALFPDLQRLGEKKKKVLLYSGGVSYIVHDHNK